ncbi:MAG: DUF3306 domain-containing protein, partial [Pseudorhodoplanes sp.]|nr:DUF3306 domain-containing protein [Pseudorhodoplanes sp.]
EQAAQPAEPEKSGTPSPALQNAAAEPAFDLSKLPSLESITANTDIRVFLQPGVPAALTRAALRRAWSADPAIRDFIGLSENSWDFTAPDSVHGFGPLLPTDDVKRMVAEIFGSGDRTAKDDAADVTPEPSAEPLPNAAISADLHRLPSDSVSADADDNADQSKQNEGMLRREKDDFALQQGLHKDEPGLEQGLGRPRRRHGGALPG